MRVIKSISSVDLPALVELSRETFIDTFADNYSSEDLNTYLEERLSETALSKELADVKNFFFFILNLEEKICGYIKITPSSKKFLKDLNPAQSKPLSSCYLERFYLTKESLGSGLAQLAMSELMSWIRENTGDQSIHLTVFIENYRAQRFYQKYGFFHAGDTVYEVGSTRDHELLYLCYLR